MAAEIAGGVALPFSMGAKMAGKIAPAGSSVMRRALAGMVGGGVSGGIGGAGYGFGDADGTLLERLAAATQQGRVGAGVGAALGGGLPVAGAALSGSGRFVGESVAPARMAAREASRRVRGLTDDIGLTADDATRRMTVLGPDAVAADIDPALAREARNAVNQAPSLVRRGGPVENIIARRSNRGERMARAMREFAGITEDMTTGQRAAEAAVERVSNDMYKPLERAHPVVTGPNVGRMMENPRIRSTFERIRREAREAAGLEGVGDDPPSFKELQEVFWELDDRATVSGREGATNAARNTRILRDEFVDALSEDVPGFREANTAYRNASARLAAYMDGYKKWTLSASEINAALDDLPTEEARDAFRVGLLQRWEEGLQLKEGSTGTVTSLLYAGPERQARLRALFGPNGNIDGFLDRMGLEGTFRITEDALRANSSTAEQLSDMAQSAPVTKNEFLNRIYDALFSPGESRRMQAEAVGNTLLSSDISELLRMMAPPRVPVARPGQNPLAGFGGAAGAIIGGQSNR